MTMRSSRPELALSGAPHGGSSRRAAGLVGCVLVALGVAALLLRLDAADPLVAGLCVSAAVWLAWVAFDFAFAPLFAAQEQARRRADAAACAPDEFVDTQATWRLP